MTLLIVVAAFVLWIYCIHWTRRWRGVQTTVVLLPLWIIPAVWLGALAAETFSRIF